MPCFEPVLTISPGWPRGDHAGREDLRAVDDAPEIDGEDPLPGLVRRRTSRCRAGCRHCSSGDGPRRTGPAPDPAGPATASRLATSVGTASTFSSPTSVAKTCPAALSAAASLSAMATFMPRPAKARAAAKPMPDAPPVTTATWSAARTAWAWEIGIAWDIGTLGDSRWERQLNGSQGATSWHAPRQVPARP